MRSRQNKRKALFERGLSTFKLRLAIQSHRREGETDAGARSWNRQLVMGAKARVRVINLKNKQTRMCLF